MIDIKQFRRHHQLTQQQCADMIYTSLRNWKRAEAGAIPFKPIWKAMLILKTDFVIGEKVKDKLKAYDL